MHNRLVATLPLDYLSRTLDITVSAAFMLRAIARGDIDLTDDGVDSAVSMRGDLATIAKLIEGEPSTIDERRYGVALDVPLPFVDRDDWDRATVTIERVPGYNEPAIYRCEAPFEAIERLNA
jgi:hypothetical protein